MKKWLLVLFFLLCGCGFGVYPSNPTTIVVRKEYQPEIKTEFLQDDKLFISVDDEDWILIVDTSGITGRRIQRIYVDKETHKRATVGEPLDYLGLYSLEDPDIIKEK